MLQGDRCMLLAVAMAALVLGACSRHAPSTSAAPPQTVAESSGPDEQDPCSLLDPKEVEAALGAPLATPPFRVTGGAPTRNGGSCAYEDAQFHRVLVDVDWEGATFAWKMMGNIQAMINQGPTKGMLHLADGSDIAGTWDEARVQGCCTFATLMGDQGLTVDAGDSNVAIPGAAKLADAALKRLAKPIAVNGNDGVAAAKTYEAAHRPKRRDPCSLLTRAEVEAIIGPLSADPQSNGDRCEYQRTTEGPYGKMRSVVDLSVDWFGGLGALHQNVGLRQGFAKGFTAGLPGAKEIESGLRGGALPPSPYWEVAYAGGTTAGGVAAVKNDVMIGVDALGLPHAQAVTILEKAMAKL